jgi:hypothetical protein
MWRWTISAQVFVSFMGAKQSTDMRKF